MSGGYHFPQLSSFWVSSTSPPTLSLGSDLADLAERLEPLEHAFRVVAERLNHLSDLAPQFLHWGFGLERPQKRYPARNKSWIPKECLKIFDSFSRLVGYVSVPVRVDFECSSEKVAFFLDAFLGNG